MRSRFAEFARSSSRDPRSFYAPRETPVELLEQNRAAWISQFRDAVTGETKRQLRRMGGEFLRDAGVLVIVLAPLESLVSLGRLTVSGGIATRAVAGFCLGYGFWLGLEGRS